MSTKFKLLFDNNELATKLSDFQKSLPSDFVVENEDDGLYVTIKAELRDDERDQYQLDRELDRYYFLTNEKICSEKVCNTGSIAIPLEISVYGPLLEGLAPQSWNNELPTQLSLWALAVEVDDLVLKTILFFQIIELTYPVAKNRDRYPKYDPPVKPLVPLMEAKLVRDWVTHSGEVGSPQLKKYCEYLNVPEQMFNRNDSVHIECLRKKLNLLQAEAKNVISIALTVEK